MPQASSSSSSSHDSHSSSSSNRAAAAVMAISDCCQRRGSRTRCCNRTRTMCRRCPGSKSGHKCCWFAADVHYECRQRNNGDRCQQHNSGSNRDQRRRSSGTAAAVTAAAWRRQRQWRRRRHKRESPCKKSARGSINETCVIQIEEDDGSVIGHCREGNGDSRLGTCEKAMFVVNEWEYRVKLE